MFLYWISYLLIFIPVFNHNDKYTFNGLYLISKITSFILKDINDVYQEVIQTWKCTFYVKFIYILYELERLNLQYLEKDILVPRGFFLKFLFVFLLGLLFPIGDKNKFLIDLRCWQLNQCLNIKMGQNNCITHCKINDTNYCLRKTIRVTVYTNFCALYLFSKGGKPF